MDCPETENQDNITNDESIYLRVGLGGVEGPVPSSSSSLSEMEDANVTAHSVSP